MNTPIYDFALRNTTVDHAHGCVATDMYPTLSRFKSKMALVWDTSIVKQRNRELFIVRVNCFHSEAQNTSTYRVFILFSYTHCPDVVSWLSYSE